MLIIINCRRMTAYRSTASISHFPFHVIFCNLAITFQKPVTWEVFLLLFPACKVDASNFLVQVLLFFIILKVIVLSESME